MPMARKTRIEDQTTLHTELIAARAMDLETPANPIDGRSRAKHSATSLVFGSLTVAGVLMMAVGAQAQAVFSAGQNLGVAVTQTVPVTASAAGTVATIEVLTGGAPNLDFTTGAGTSTCPSAALTVSATCNQSVTFTPVYPGLRTGAVVLLDLNNNVLGTAYLSGVGVGGLDVLTPGNILPFAGVKTLDGYPTNNIPATKANLKQPAGVVLDGAGNVYLADSAHNEIRMVCFSTTSPTIAGVQCPAAGDIVDVAGTGAMGYSGDSHSSLTATMNAPAGLSLDGAGNLYIADSGNNVIRMINAATGIITTVVGDGTLGYSGDGGPATAAELNNAQGVTIDAFGDIVIADTNNQVIRRVDAVTRIISTLAGNGVVSGAGDGKGTFTGFGVPAIQAGLSLPYSVAFDLDGNLYIADTANSAIRKVTATGGMVTANSIINTFAGFGPAHAGGGCINAPLTTADLDLPEGVAVDPAGNVYITDTGNQCVRKANVTSGQLEIIAINLQPSLFTTGAYYAGDYYPAPVYSPFGIALDGLGNVYYADYYYMLINEIQSNRSVLNYQATSIRQGQQSPPMAQEVENDGNASSSITAITPDLNAAVDPASTTCGPLAFTLTEDDDCNVGAIFSPSTTINPSTLPGIVVGNVDVANNTINNLLDIVLIGNGQPVNSTSITLVPTPNPSEFGKSVSFAVAVTSGTGVPTGTVTLTDTFNGATTTLGTITLSGGDGTYTTTSLAVGVHNISASYGGDATHLGTAQSGQPATVTQTVYEATKTVLTAVPASPSAFGASITFTAKVSVTDGGAFPLDGSVTFNDSAATLTNNTVPIAAGVATYTTAALVEGVNVITATYTPNTSNLIQGSTGTLSQDSVVSSSVSVTSAPNPSIYGSPVTFSVSVPNSGPAIATGKVNIVIVPQGQTTPAYPITATLGGNPATGTATISTLPVGTYTATANYVGDNNFAASSSTLATPQVVNQVSTTITAVATPNPGIAGKAEAITATVTPSSGTVAPTGSVTFTDTFNGTTVTLGAGAITLSATGTATVNSSTLAPGTHSIVAGYSGDANDAKSSVTLSLVVNQATTISVVVPTPNPALVLATITYTATVTGTGAQPTGTVNFFANGTIALGSATLNATGTASVTNATLVAGTYQITAVYAGDTNDSGSTSAPVSEVIGTIPTMTGLTTASTTGSNPQTILIGTVENSGVSGPVPTGTITFKNGTTVVGTATLDADGVATMTPELNTGSYSIIAYYPGDGLHGASQSGPISITGQASSYSITVTPPTVSIAVTQNSNLTVSLASVSGFTDSIALGCVGLPAGVNCHFSPILVPLAANATASSTLTIDTNNPLGGGATAMNSQPGKARAELAALFFPFSLAFGGLLWRFRKRNANLWSVVLILVLSGAALLATGCSGGFSQNYAAPGTYTIQVVGVGQNSDVAQYQSVTLTITK